MNGNKMRLGRKYWTIARSHNRLVKNFPTEVPYDRDFATGYQGYSRFSGDALRDVFDGRFRSVNTKIADSNNNFTSHSSSQI